RGAGPGNELRMRRHRVDASRNDCSDAFNQSHDVLIGHQVHSRMIVLGYDMLAEHDLDPTGNRKHFFRVAKKASTVLEQTDGIAKRFRDIHPAAISPKRCIST